MPILNIVVWNQFPRRDPLAKYKDRLAKAAEQYWNDDYMDVMPKASIAAYVKAKAALRVRHAKK